MSDVKKTSDRLLEKTLEALRKEELTEDQVIGAAERVWEKLSAEEGSAPKASGIRGCEDVQRLIPAYLNGELAAAKSLIVEDHTHECIPCRKALTAARTESIAPAKRIVRQTGWNPWLKWGSLAASFLVTLLLLQWAAFNGLLPYGTSSAAIVTVAHGQLFTIFEDTLVELDRGAEIETHQTVRTAKGSGAVLRLEDGSEVELSERTQLSLASGWGGTTVQLQRGNVIVEATDQGADHLFVSTGDCRVAVKGTIFSVSHGMKGSRVAVLEGEVAVEGVGANTTLLPGQQFSSQKRLVPVSIAEEFSWSQRSEEHLALLDEISQLNRDIQQATFGEQLRFTSELKDMLPEGTVVYGAVPNVSEGLGDVYQQFLERVEANPALSEWYASKVNTVEADHLGQLVDRIRLFGQQLGDEIVFALVADSGMEHPKPLLLSRVLDSVTLEALIREQLESFQVEVNQEEVVRLIADPFAESPAEGGRLYVVVNETHFMISPSLELLQQVVGGASSLQATFRETLDAQYADGVDWLFVADLEGIFQGEIAEKTSEGNRLALQRLGITQIKDMVIERKMVDGTPENRAALNYSGSDSGLVSWIASPGPMGGLEYVSQDAHMAAGFVVENPSKLVSDLLSYLELSDPSAWEDFVQFQVEHGVDIKADLAEQLGGEVVFALDGPVLPTPSWKLIIEVYYWDVLKKTIEWAVEEVNTLAQAEGNPGIILTDLGNDLYSITAGDLGTTVYFQYVDASYLIVAPDPELISRSVQYRASAYSLQNAPKFLELLPVDHSVNVSGIFYHNLAPLLEPLVSSSLAESIADLTPEGQETLQRLVGSTPPMVAALYSSPGSISVSTSGDLESLWLNANALSAFGGADGIAKMLGGAVQ